MNKYVCIIICVIIVCIMVVVCFYVEKSVYESRNFYIDCDTVRRWQERVGSDTVLMKYELESLKEEIQKNSKVLESVYNDYVERRLLK